MAKKHIIGLDTLRARLDEYEDKYGWPSEKLEMAFRNSPLDESDDFHDWSLLYTAWEDGRKRQAQLVS